MEKMMTAHRVKALRNRAFDTALVAVQNVNAATPLRWQCHHHATSSDIEAWVVGKNNRKEGLEIIAGAWQMEGVDARANAELIVQAVNNHIKLWPLIVQLMEALELCLACNLTWEAEIEADIALRRARQVIGKG